MVSQSNGDERLMVGYTLETQLTNYIQNMHHQGILDECFDQVKALQNKHEPHFLADLIDSYITDAEHCISQVSNFLTRPHVNFERATHVMHKLKGSSSSLGGQRMTAACRALHVACQDRQYPNSVQELGKVRDEFENLKACLTEIAQMERRIHAYFQSIPDIA